MAIEKWLAITSVGLFAMFAGEMISVYYFMLTVPEDAVVAQGFTPDPKLIQFVSIGVAPAGILAAVAYIMSRNYGSKQIIKSLVSDGVLVSTPAGSTAYNLSVHGPILSLNSKKLSISPISAFRPRRWKGKVVSDKSKISIRNLNPIKRPSTSTFSLTTSTF